MKFKINEEEFELQYSFRVNIYFEQIQGHTIDFSNLSPNDLVTLFYCVVIATLQKNKKPVISMLDFLDAVDNNGGDKALIDFANWFIEVMKAQYEVLSSIEEDKKAKKVSKKKTN